MKQRWLTPFVVVCVTAVILMLWDSPPQRFLQDNKPPSENRELHPHTIVIGSTDREFDDNGTLVNTFKAESSRYFQTNPNRRTNSDYVHISAPRITVYGEDNTHWHISADSATSYQNGNTVELVNQVSARHLQGDSQTRELSTEFLRLHPRRQYAESDKAVTIADADTTTTAVGLQAKLDEEIFVLLSEVESTHAPQPEQD